MRLKKKTKVNQDKSKLSTNSKGDQVVYSKVSKKEIEQLKSAYKSGKLKFDSKDIAESILENFKRGFTK